MKLRDLSGKVRTARLTTDHASSSYGQAVLVISGQGHGTFDVAGWRIVEATERELEALERAGYHLPEEAEA